MVFLCLSTCKSDDTLVGFGQGFYVFVVSFVVAGGNVAILSDRHKVDVQSDGKVQRCHPILLYAFN